MIKRNRRIILSAMLAIGAVVFASLFDTAFKPKGTQSRSGQACLIDQNSTILNPFWSYRDGHSLAVRYLVNHRSASSFRFWDTLHRRLEIKYPLVLRKRQIESVFCQSATVPIGGSDSNLVSEVGLLEYIELPKPELPKQTDNVLFSVCLALDGRATVYPPTLDQSVVVECVDDAAEWELER